jgi:hypothetical protein
MFLRSISIISLLSTILSIMHMLSAQIVLIISDTRPNSRTVSGCSQKLSSSPQPNQYALRASESPHSLELDVRHSARECGVKGPRMYALVILRHSEPYVTGSCCFGPASPSPPPPLAFVLNIEPQRAIQQQLIFDQQRLVSA